MVIAKKDFQREMGADIRELCMRAHGQTERDFDRDCPQDSYVMQDPRQPCIMVAREAYQIDKTKECESSLPFPVNFLEATTFHDLQALPYLAIYLL
jgi:hypothetical protein